MRLQTYTHQTLPDLMGAVTRAYETRYGITFEQFKFFPPALLASLHAESQIGEATSGCVTSPQAALTHEAATTLTLVANTHRPTDAQRRQYLDALLSIYRVLPQQPDDLLDSRDVLFLGIEREGRILAQELDWLPIGHEGRVHAKRMRVDGGILVGLSRLPEAAGCRQAVIVDGAIASGATLIAIMDALNSPSVRIYSAHAASEGVRSLCRFAKERGIDLSVSVGFVTAGLSDRYYAEQEGRQIVGDLGDMIAPLFHSSAPPTEQRPPNQSHE